MKTEKENFTLKKRKSIKINKKSKEDKEDKGGGCC
jgi:hypothetical protein